jgi:hypothetical protein
MKGPFFVERAVLFSAPNIPGLRGQTALALLQPSKLCLPGTPACRFARARAHRQFTHSAIRPFLLFQGFAPPGYPRLTMNASVRLLLRVLYPRVGWPHGVTG